MNSQLFQVSTCLTEEQELKLCSYTNTVNIICEIL